MARAAIHLLLTLGVLAIPANAQAGRKGDLLVLAWSPSGELALVQETTQGPAGGSSIAFRVVGPGVEQRRYEVSNDVAKGEAAPIQRVLAEDCRARLVELRDLLKDKRFKGIQLNGAACKSEERAGLIVVAADRAREADASELEPTPSGDALASGDWRIQLQDAGLSLRSPKQHRRLRLPRPIHPASAHVLLSPTRRLLLVLESVDGGDQILAAGFSSKTGQIADFE